MSEIIHVILRTFLILVVVFIMFKLLGKKQVSQMNMFDYITGITIGSIVADISLDIEKNLLAGLISLAIYCLVSILISYISLKSIRLRDFLNGKETLLIEEGKILRENLSKNRLTINTLETEARLMGYFDMSEINYAYLEPNGKISFCPFEKDKPSTKKDINVPTKDNGLVYNLIIDATVVKENLSKAHITEKWLNHELKVKGYEIDEVMLATIDKEKKLTIFPKQNN